MWWGCGQRVGWRATCRVCRLLPVYELSRSTTTACAGCEVMRSPLLMCNVLQPTQQRMCRRGGGVWDDTRCFWVMAALVEGLLGGYYTDLSAVVRDVIDPAPSYTRPCPTTAHPLAGRSEGRKRNGTSDSRMGRSKYMFAARTQQLSNAQID